MKQKKQNENKIEYRQAKIAGSIFLAACLLLCKGSCASAEQASLVSASAAVYEAADENSSTVGNLVQGNTFELQESITAENGERWYLITMSNGNQGYIKGEVATDTNAPAPVQEEEAPEPAQAPGEGEGGGEEENPDGEEAADESSPETETEEEGAGTAGRLPVNSNTQQKKYFVIADADRVRTQVTQGGTGDGQMVSGQVSEQMPQAGVNKTFILLLCVILFSAALLRYNFRRMKQQLFGTRTHLKIRKKKKAKRTKKKKTVKEAGKWKNNSLQK